MVKLEEGQDGDIEKPEGGQHGQQDEEMPQSEEGQERQDEDMQPEEVFGRLRRQQTRGSKVWKGGSL